MSCRINRRTMLKTGALSAGLITGTGYGGAAEKKSVNAGSPRKPYWNPGPDRELVRDLAPGTTPVRLAGYLNWKEGTGVADTSGVKAAIGMEAQVTTNIDGPKAHRRLMDDIGSDRVKVNLDPISTSFPISRPYMSRRYVPAGASSTMKRTLYG